MKKIACDVAIIGGGAGGLSLASGCAQLGLDVVIIERALMGGDCLNVGCIPSKSLLAAAKTFYNSKHSAHLGLCAETISLDFSKTMQHVHQVISNIADHDSVERFESLGARVIQSTGHFVEPSLFEAGDNRIQAKYFVIATGSSPFVPPISGLDTIAFLTNETIFDLKVQPKHLIVIGGGPIGCELAQAFAMLGSKVSILEAFDILPKDDADCVSIVRDSLLKMNIDLFERVKLHHIKQHADGGIEVNLEHQGKTLSINGAHILVAAGRRPNVNGLDLEKAGVHYTSKGIDVNARLQTSNKTIYAIGDVVGPYQFTHMASYQAGIVLRNIVFKWPAKVNYQAIPWVTYTEPELAHVGMATQESLKPPDGQITQWLFVDNDRAQTGQNTIGKINVLTDKKARILGVTIVGDHAGELILPWVMAIRDGKSLRAFTDVIVPYPTLSEISKQVAGAFYKPTLFSSKVRTIVKWLNKFS